MNAWHAESFLGTTHLQLANKEEAKEQKGEKSLVRAGFSNPSKLMKLEIITQKKLARSHACHMNQLLFYANIMLLPHYDYMQGLKYHPSLTGTADNLIQFWPIKDNINPVLKLISTDTRKFFLSHTPTTPTTQTTCSHPIVQTLFQYSLPFISQELWDYCELKLKPKASEL